MRENRAESRSLQDAQLNARMGELCALFPSESERASRRRAVGALHPAIAGAVARGNDPGEPPLSPWRDMPEDIASDAGIKIAFPTALEK